MNPISTKQPTNSQTTTRKVFFPLVLFLFLFGSALKAQVVTYTETFDIAASTTFLPYGWSQGKYLGTDPDNYWDRLTVGTLPPASPQSGSAMLRYRSWFTNAGEKAYVATKPLDMRAIPGTGALMNFWMFRDEWGGFGGPTYMDSITVYVNTTPDMVGTPVRLTETATTSLNIPRPSSQAPPSGGPTSGMWKQYFYTVPAIASPNVYVIIMGCSRFGNDIYIDQFTVDTYPLNQVYTPGSATIYQQNPATTARGAINQQIIGCKVNMVGGLNKPALSFIQFNTNGSDNPTTDIANAKLWWTGGTPNFDPLFATQIGTWTPNGSYPWATNYMFLDTLSNNGVTPGFYPYLDNGDNYFWITYDIRPTATQGNYVDAEFIALNFSVTKMGSTGASGASTVTVPDIVGITNGYTAHGLGIPKFPTIRTVVSSAGTTVTLNGTNSGAVSGNTYYTNLPGGTITPTLQTLAGRRKIDVIYCNASYSVGTSWAGYQSNDFVNSVKLAGDNIPAPGIASYAGAPGPFSAAVNTGSNTINQYAGTTYGCNGPFPRPCPFQSHPPDYELFNGIPGKTTSVTQNKNYQIYGGVGAYGSGNAVAAWIDYNGDGTFNNIFDTIIKTGVGGVSGANTLTVNATVISTAAISLGNEIGLNVGQQVSGPGIGAGAVITSIVGNTVTLSVANSATVSGSTMFVNVYNPLIPTSLPEKILQSGSLGSFIAINRLFTVPAAATPGKTRMRVREVWIVYNMSPCAPYTYGEVEDYEVTIVPDCAGPAGWTTWLGFTDDWTDPSNWCPAKAPIQINSPLTNPDVRIPGGPTPAGAYDYVRPVIRSGVLAIARKLRIENNDTITINAPTPGSLVVSDSMYIQGAVSKLIVKSADIDTVQVDNGALNYSNTPALNNANMPPLRNSTLVRSFLAFTQAELLAKGMIANDVITEISMHIQRSLTAGPAYTNFTISYYYTDPLWVAKSSLAGGTTPPVVGLPATPTQIYTNPSLSLAAPVGTYTTVNFPLTAPFTWNGGANQLVIVICYDKATTSGGRDEPSYTQTTPDSRYLTLNIVSTATPPPAACIMEQNITATSTIAKVTSNVAGTNIITVISPNMNNLIVGQTITRIGIPAGAYITAVNIPGNQITISAPTTAGWSGAPNPAIGINIGATNGLYRPNLTFKFDRPYSLYPISVAGHWGNNGTFIPGKSVVTMTGGTSANVDGLSTTTFYDFTVNKTSPGHVVRNTDFIVTDLLTLTSGRLKLNNGLVDLTNPAPGALVQTGGYIQADNDVISNNIAPYGRFHWPMAPAATGTRIIPFATANNKPIYLEYNALSGNHDVTFGTYRTNQNNTNIPGPEVTNIFGVANAVGGGGYGQGGHVMADRYFLVSNATPAGAHADLKFRFVSGLPPVTADGEDPQGGTLNLRAQRWNNIQDRWVPLQTGQTYTAGPAGSASFVNLTDFALFDSSSWWTIVGEATPLPVSLLEFKAEKQKDRVKLKWTTASEINSSHFEVHRTVDNNDFSFIGRVESRGPSNNLIDYYTYDNAPLDGIQYYYLTQVDVDGRSEKFGPVSATFGHDVFEIVTTTISPTDHGLTVVFNYDSQEPYSYKIMDMTGRIVVQKDKNPAVNGINVIDIDASLAKGVYNITLQNRDRVVSRKFFY